MTDQPWWDVLAKRLEQIRWAREARAREEAKARAAVEAAPDDAELVFDIHDQATLKQ